MTEAQRIDISAHILPKRFFDEVAATAPPGFYMQKRVSGIPTLTDLDARFRIMDRVESYAQILSLALPPIEAVAPPRRAAELARIANEELASLVDRYPERFPAAVAGLPLNDVDATLRELDHAIGELGLRGVQLFTHINGTPLDDPSFLPIFEAIAALDVPIWLHPARGAAAPDYPGESTSRFEIWHVFGWPFDTTIAMTRLIFGGVLDKVPGLKIITHHLGGTVPFLECYRTFYADTALYGSPPALECGLAFFGTERVLFGSDMPFDIEGGSRYIRLTLAAIEEMSAPAAVKQRMLRDNARRLLKL